MIDTNSTILEADMKNPVHVSDLILVLESYKTGKMGDSIPFTEAEKARLITQFIIHPSVLGFLIYSNGQIAGASVCFTTFSTFTTANVLNIHDLCIMDEFQGKGLGRKLTEHITQKARDLLCSRITLEVREDNGIAKDLYQKFGFEDYSPIMHFWRKKLQ